jgi:hypothetical protein
VVDNTVDDYIEDWEQKEDREWDTNEGDTWDEYVEERRMVEDPVRKARVYRPESLGGKDVCISPPVHPDKLVRPVASVAQVLERKLESFHASHPIMSTTLADEYQVYVWCDGKGKRIINGVGIPFESGLLLPSHVLNTCVGQITLQQGFGTPVGSKPVYNVTEPYETTRFCTKTMEDGLVLLRVITPTFKMLSQRHVKSSHTGHVLVRRMGDSCSSPLVWENGNYYYKASTNAGWSGCGLWTNGGSHLCGVHMSGGDPNSGVAFSKEIVSWFFRAVPGQAAKNALAKVPAVPDLKGSTTANQGGDSSSA